MYLFRGRREYIEIEIIRRNRADSNAPAARVLARSSLLADLNWVASQQQAVGWLEIEIEGDP